MVPHARVTGQAIPLTLHYATRHPLCVLVLSACHKSFDNADDDDLYNKSKVVPYSITSDGHGADPGFLAVSPYVTLVINPMVGCRYFPPGLRLLSPLWPPPNYTAWRQVYAYRLSSLPKATTQWCPASTRTCESQVRCLSNSATAVTYSTKQNWCNYNGAYDDGNVYI